MSRPIKERATALRDRMVIRRWRLVKACVIMGVLIGVVLAVLYVKEQVERIAQEKAEQERIVQEKVRIAEWRKENPDLVIQLAQLPAGARELEMVAIPPGEFQMGSPSQEKDRYSNEGPQHQVRLTKPFWLGRYEVTQAQWKAVMGSNSNPSYFKGDNLPVEQVSWNDCQSFVEKLNALGQGTFRLPTEAEWEYVCRAGMTTRFYWGDDSSYSQVGKYAWYVENSGLQTHPVGEKEPNAWGLYDMSGNVWEWCEDWYGAYSGGLEVDPKGQESGETRVLRGGIWSFGPRLLRSAYRSSNGLVARHHYVGFRLARTP